MAKSRGAGAKKPAKKQATAKSGAKKAPTKKAVTRASAPAAKTAVKKAPKAKAASKPAKSASTKPPAKASSKTSAKASSKDAKSAAKPSRPSKAPPAKAARSSKPPQADADLPARRSEPAEPPRPTITIPEGIGAHPDAQLSKAEVDALYEKLVTERERVVAGFDRHLQEALGEAGVMPDETDMAQRSTEQAYLIRFADKERKLLSEIEHALEKLRSGEYGVCEGTEEPIGFKRLELRPWTRYSVGYKEQMERERSQHRR